MVYKRQGVDHWLWRWYTILYIFSVVDNFELIVGLGVGIPFFILFLL
jgi:hypothetical protein